MVGDVKMEITVSNAGDILSEENSLKLEQLPEAWTTKQMTTMTSSPYATISTKELSIKLCEESRWFGKFRQK